MSHEEDAADDAELVSQKTVCYNGLGTMGF